MKATADRTETMRAMQWRVRESNAVAEFTCSWRSRYRSRGECYSIWDDAEAVEGFDETVMY